MPLQVLGSRLKAIRTVSLPKATGVVVYLTTALALTALSAWLDERFKTEIGLTQTFHDGVSFEDPPRFRRIAPEIDLDFLEGDPELPRRFFSVRWQGVWYLPDDGTVDIYAGADDSVDVWVDGEVVLQRSFERGMRTAVRPVALAAGFHDLSVSYAQRGSGYYLNVQWAPAGKTARSFDPETLFPVRPSQRELQVNQRLRTFRRCVAAVWILPPVLFGLLVGGPPLARRWQHAIAPLHRRLAFFALINCIGINLALGYLPWFQHRTTLHYTRAFIVRHVQHSDSWMPMRRALDYLDEPRDALLYSQFFSAGGFKFQYPPTSLLLLEPLRHSPVGDVLSYAALNAASWYILIATAFVVWRILTLSVRRYLGTQRERWFPDGLVLLVLAMVFTFTFFPIVRSFYVGQIQTWINLLFAAVIWAWLAGRRGVAGVLSGVICVIKPTLGLLLLWGLVRKQWRFVTGWAIPVVCFGVLSLWTYGLATHLDYLRFLSFVSQRGESFYANQSLNGFLHRLLIGGSELWAFVYAPYHPLIYLGATLGTVVLVGMALFWKRRQNRASELNDFLVAALSFTLAAPIVWDHHYGLTLPMFAVALPATLAARRVAPIGVGLLGLAYVLTSNDFQALGTRTNFNLLQSYLFFGALVLLYFLYRLRGIQQHAVPAETQCET